MDKSKVSRRKFISTTAAGTVASVAVGTNAAIKPILNKIKQHKKVTIVFIA